MTELPKLFQLIADTDPVTVLSPLSDNIFDARPLSILYGKTGEGKSFFALALVIREEGSDD